MEFYYDQLRLSYSKIFQYFLNNLANIKTKLKKGPFKSEKEMQLPSIQTEFEFIKHLEERVCKLIGNDSQKYHKLQKLLMFVNSEHSSTVDNLLKAYYDLCQFNMDTVTSLKVDDNNIVGIIPTRSNDDLIVIEDVRDTGFRLKFKFDKSNEIYDENEFIESSMITWQKILEQVRQPTPNEYLAVHLAYNILKANSSSNYSLNKNFAGMGTPGFRKYTQTYMSLTDPGPGHIFGTTTKLAWMNRGAIVHVEHLERPKNQCRDEIESYRIPSITNFIFTRFHVSNVTPTTFYLGRIVKDSGTFDNDLLRIVRLFAGCANNAFSMGAAECKLSMDGMTTYETVKFMRALRGEIIKNPYQILSAAWNLNNPLVDDFNTEENTDNAENASYTRKTVSVKYVDKFQIAKQAILFTKIGGFDKITWDGASDTYPSKCIVPYQLALWQACTVVHMAHSVGLLTYFSAGFKLDEIKVAVLAGIDGIGIGGAQILRLMDEKTGYHGPYLQESIDGILFKRDEAANSIYGKSVSLLSRLDTMHFEGSLSAEEDKLRETLFETLIKRYKTLGENIKDYDNLMHEVNNSLNTILATFKSITELVEDKNLYLCRIARVNRIENPLVIKGMDKDDLLKFKLANTEVLHKQSERAAFNIYNMFPLNSYLTTHKKQVFIDLIEKYFTEKDTVDFRRKSFHRNYNQMINWE